MNKEKLNAMLNELLEDINHIQKVALECAVSHDQENAFNNGFFKGTSFGSDSIRDIVTRFVKEMKEELNDEE